MKGIHPFFWRNVVLVILLMPLCLVTGGCKTNEVATLKPLSNPDGLPLRIGFVYEEKVFSSGNAFSFASKYWEYFYPQVAGVFEEAIPFTSYASALQSDVDAIVVAKNFIYGSPSKFKFSLKVRAVERDESTILERSREEKFSDVNEYHQSLAAFGRLMRDTLSVNGTIRSLVKKKEEL